MSKFSTCVAPFFYLAGVKNPYEDLYIFVLCFLTTVQLFVAAFVMNDAAEMVLNFNSETRTRNVL